MHNVLNHPHSYYPPQQHTTPTRHPPEVDVVGDVSHGRLVVSAVPTGIVRQRGVFQRHDQKRRANNLKQAKNRVDANMSH